MFLDNIIKKQKKKDNEEVFKEEISKCVDVEYLEDLLIKLTYSDNSTLACAFLSFAKSFASYMVIYASYQIIYQRLINGIDMINVIIFNIHEGVLSVGFLSLLQERLKNDDADIERKLDIIKKRLYELQNMQSEILLNEAAEQSKEFFEAFEEKGEKLNLNRLK